jgi:Aspartyl/Asparaginyl beta-hydroxylase
MTQHPLETQADARAAAGDYAGALALLNQLVTGAPDHFGAWIKLSAMAGASGDTARAAAAVDHALTLQPLDLTALLMRARQLEAAGRSDEAGEAYGRALAQAPDPAPPQLGPILGHAAEKYSAWQQGQADKLRAAVSAVTPLTDKLDRLITNSLHLTGADRAGPTHYCYPGLPEIPFHPDAQFGWMAALEAETDAIEAAFHNLVGAEAAQLVPYIQYPAGVPLDGWAALNHNRDWTAIHLIQNGRVVDANARHCPALMDLLATLPQPDIAGAGPNAMFSLLAPGAHIPPHTGISNARLVCHLPLIVPAGCWFRVGGETREWVRGKAWVFDDTVEHEARNPSGELRVILIIDLWHPGLDESERAGIKALIEASGQLHGL